MKNLTPNELFDLSSFKHAKLFEFASDVFEVIPKIKEYLKSFKTFKIEVTVPEGVYLANSEFISIGRGTVLEPGCYIEGPCIIGENCTVRHGAYIRGNFIAGDHSVIGHDTEVKNSVMLNHAHAAHFAYLGDSIVGNHVNLGAGTKCANLKFDRSTIILSFQGQKIDTGLKKFGAIFGDGSQTGCNSVTNPGTIFGKNSFCYPCTNVSGIVPSDHFVRPDTKNSVNRILE